MKRALENTESPHFSFNAVLPNDLMVVLMRYAHSLAITCKWLLGKYHELEMARYVDPDVIGRGVPISDVMFRTFGSMTTDLKYNVAYLLMDTIVRVRQFKLLIEIDPDNLEDLGYKTDMFRVELAVSGGLAVRISENPMGWSKELPEKFVEFFLENVPMLICFTTHGTIYGDFDGLCDTDEFHELGKLYMGHL